MRLGLLEGRRSLYPSAAVLARWSPYRFRRPAGGNSDIYLVEADSATPLRLTTDPAEDFAPSWTPAGEAISYCAEIRPIT